MQLRLATLAAAAFAALSTFSVPDARAASDTYEIDSVHTTVLFRVKHMNTSWAYGRFDDVKGTVAYDAAKPEAATVNFRIQTASVDTGNAKRDKHLQGPDFFDTAKFPEATFASTAVKGAGEGKLEVTGNLTLHGTTKPVTVTMELAGSGKGRNGESMIGFEGTFSIKRSEFGMDKMLQGVGDDVRLTISIEAAAK